MEENDVTKLKVINELLKHGNVTLACRRVGLPRITYYSWLKNDDNFNKSVQDARDDFIE